MFELQGTNYLLIVDYFSRYIEIQKLHNTTSANIITVMKAIVARHGIPSALISDNGTQYASKEMKEYTERYGFNHITSSPYFSQSNGLAEKSAKTVKSFWKRQMIHIWRCLVTKVHPSLGVGLVLLNY